ncbi:MAG: hypothetical protein ABWW66_08130 [Archaeoglobaceae archaeon]
MRLALILAFAVLFGIVRAEPVVHIYLSKESVNLGETIVLGVYAETGRPYEVAIVGEKHGEVICRSLYEDCSRNWIFRIPEDWEEGTYHIKVTVDDTRPLEFFEKFEVVKPKILDVKIPVLVYQGRHHVNVTAEAAEGSSPVLRLRLIGKNVAIDFEERAESEGGKKYFADVELNLRREDVIEPGKYFLEVYLYCGKLWDVRRYEVEIVEPTIVVDVKDRLKRGEKLEVRIKTNRHEEGYDGIVVTLVGKNFVVTKYPLLDDEGEAVVAFETAPLEAGKYEVYVRDTCKTSRVPLEELARYYYDLERSSGFAEVIRASDDVLVKLEVEVLDSEAPKSITVEPQRLSIQAGEVAELKLNFGNAKFVEFVAIMRCDHAEFVAAKADGEFIERSLGKDCLHVLAAANSVTVAVKGIEPGECVVSFRNARINDENGNYVELGETKAELEIFETSSSEIEATVLINETNVPSTVTSEITTTTTISATQTIEAIERLDFGKLAMFVGSFYATYLALRVLRRKR